MEQQVTSTTTKGVFIALIIIVIALVTYFGNMQENKTLGYLSYIILIGGIIWSVFSYGKQIDHRAGFGAYFTHGFKVAAMVTALMIIFVIIFLFAFPEMKEKAIDAARKSMNEQGTMTDAGKERALEMTRKFFMVFTVGGTLLLYLFFGTLAALVGAAITKKNPQPFHDRIA